MGFQAMADKAAGLIAFAKEKVMSGDETATSVLKSLFMPVLSGLVNAAQTELGSLAGAEKKALVLDYVGQFYDAAVGPLVIVFLRPVVRWALLFVTGILIDSFVEWLKNYASPEALKPFQQA